MARLLGIAPWCWPDAADPTPEGRLALGRAAALAGCSTPAQLPAGACLLVSVEGTAGSLSRMDVAPSPTRCASQRPLGLSEELWERALEGCLRSLPLVWRCPSAAPLRRPERARYLGGSRPTFLEGDSFGLSVALAQASVLLDLPPSADLAASAAIDSKGARLLRVRGLETKVRTLLKLAPRVRRVLVAAEQPGLRALQDAIGEQIRLIPCATLEEAFLQALPEVEAHWLTTGSDPTLRAQRAQALFDLALGHRSSLPDWSPVRHATALALGGDGTRPGWTPLPPTQRAQLEFVRAIASRHNKEVAALPTDDLCGALRQPDRSRAAAHIVQQSADTGVPEPDAALELTTTVLAGRSLADAFPADLRLLGARGRLLDRLGRRDQALQEQLALAAEWLERGEETEASYPLTEAYRLAGALRDLEAWDRLEALQAWKPSAWTRVTRAQALVEFGRLDEAIELLQVGCSEVKGNEVVGLGVQRVLRRALRARGSSVEDLDQSWSQQFEAARERLASVTRGAERERADRQLRWLESTRLLAQLDDALGGGAEAEAIALAARLVEAEPERLQPLADECRGSTAKPWPEHLLRHYPY